MTTCLSGKGQKAHRNALTRPVRVEKPRASRRTCTRCTKINLELHWTSFNGFWSHWYCQCSHIAHSNVYMVHWTHLVCESIVMFSFLQKICKWQLRM